MLLDLMTVPSHAAFQGVRTACCAAFWTQSARGSIGRSAAPWQHTGQRKPYHLQCLCIAFHCLSEQVENLECRCGKRGNSNLEIKIPPNTYPKSHGHMQTLRPRHKQVKSAQNSQRPHNPETLCTTDMTAT